MKAGIKAGDIITEYDGRKVAKLRRAAEARGGDAGRARGAGRRCIRDGKTAQPQAKVAALDEPDQKVAGEAGEKGKLGVAVEPVTPAIAKQLGPEGRRQRRGRAARRGRQPGRRTRESSRET